MTAPTTELVNRTVTATDGTCMCIARVGGLNVPDTERFARMLEASALLYETVQVLAGALDLAYEAHELAQPACSKFAWQILKNINRGG
ncbi:hypothetical protein AB870_09315 [Pandoraea faecigallinarum]|uniref:Uncharacterized protein n=1 Tax=Pandoraea faecigallinarum TaxID=656179 RepID=A0A0H3WUR3_9BURK|nr:hypothetical protein [Pandoraea faecigallinarum]AKM30256.1 hypothetical protein AB870_09315 [Pandoraea faecigallinarum]